MKYLNGIKLSIVATAIMCSSLNADTASDIEQLKKEIAELKAQTKTIANETVNLQNGFSYTVVDTEASQSGLGAAASKVYYSKSPLSIGGYGEMYYSHTSKEASKDSSKVDVYRFVPYIGYKFSDNIVLNTEIEFEHGGIANDDGDSEGGEVRIEFMYLDFLVNDSLNFRVGNMLMPVGLINERHEPTLFTTVQRPNTSKYILPTTWNENAIMVYGNLFENFEYKLAGVSALASDIDSDTNWIRSARGGSFTNSDPKLGIVGRIDYTGINGVLIGASAYTDSNINIYDVHMDLKYKGFRTYGTYAQANRSDAQDLTDTATLPSQEEANGGYINFSYDILSSTASEYKLPIFVQFESVSTADERTDGTSLDSLDTTTVGINFFPHKQVVLKADYAMQNQNSIDSDTFSISMGFIF